MSAAVINDEQTLRIKPVTLPTDRPKNKGEIGHGRDKLDDMTAKEDKMEAAIALMAQAIATNQQVNRRPSVPAWVAAGVASLALLISVTGSRWTSSGESDLRRDIAVISEKLNQADERQKERERVADRERALINERYRQMSIALESRGIKLPVQ